MAKTLSNMLPLGVEAPYFDLLDTVSGKNLNLNELKGKIGTVIMFICNHCPFVIHINEEIVSISNDYIKKGIGFIAISSNDVENYPQDSPELMKEVADQNSYPFPYLYDQTQDVARAYQAACTPDFYLFNNDLKLVYRGQLDHSRPESETPITGRDLRMALDYLLIGKTIEDKQQKPSMGCNIKWK
ncbi:thioredoxin family protein [Ichthyobacterium seriolicida]|uniref:Alkyl hydroperoxide reductase n=1 Tax=Ichthyobacterium seriolicida TaxID=242600 RepID=A0A1J1DWZ0_9FLAO|nr:thioredoxin family protein [Ichthyobacterium seriolicida]BAV94375.1 alkyl hydroperoxide reductase [Ichthyobacterium seriolicida]